MYKLIVNSFEQLAFSKSYELIAKGYASHSKNTTIYFYIYM